MSESFQSRCVHRLPPRNRRIGTSPGFSYNAQSFHNIVVLLVGFGRPLDDVGNSMAGSSRQKSLLPMREDSIVSRQSVMPKAGMDQ